MIKRISERFQKNFFFRFHLTAEEQQTPVAKIKPEIFWLLHIVHTSRAYKVLINEK